MLVKIGNGNAYFFKIVTGNVRYLVHVDCIIVSIMRVLIFVSVIFLIQNEFLMPYCVVEIGKPPNTFHANKLSPISVNTASSCMKRVVIGNIELPIATVNACAKP